MPELQKLNLNNIDAVLSFISGLNDKTEKVKKIEEYKFRYIFNQALLTSLWKFIIDPDKNIRHKISDFYNIRIAYLEQLFSENKNSINELKIILRKYPEEFYYSWFVRDYNFYELLPNIKEKIIMRNDGSTSLKKNQKWAALISGYSMGDKTLFTLIKDFINKEDNIFSKYQDYAYVFGIFNSDNERKLLLEVLNRKDVLTDMEEAERSNIIVDNYFTAFVFPNIPRLFPNFKVDVETECLKGNKFKDNDTNEVEQQAFFSFRKLCLYSETLRWFKNQKLIK